MSKTAHWTELILVSLFFFSSNRTMPGIFQDYPLTPTSVYSRLILFISHFSCNVETNKLKKNRTELLLNSHYVINRPHSNSSGAQLNGSV